MEVVNYLTTSNKLIIQLLTTSLVALFEGIYGNSGALPNFRTKIAKEHKKN